MTKNNKLVNKNWTYFGEIKNGKPNGKGKKEFFIQIKEKLEKKIELKDHEFLSRLSGLALDNFIDEVRILEEGTYSKGELNGMATIAFKSIQLVEQYPDEIDEDLDFFYCIFKDGIMHGKAMLLPNNRKDKIEIFDFDNGEMYYLGEFEFDDPLVHETNKYLGFDY